MPPRSKKAPRPQSGGPWQHYLPAAGYLSGFSDVRVEPKRESLLWVGRRARPQVWRTKASRVGAAHDIYTLPREHAAALNVDVDFVDRVFSRVEPRLADAVDYLVASGRDEEVIASVDAVPWASILVPFAAQLFARGIDYERRVANRASTTGLPPADAISLARARLYDALWLSGAVARTSWTVMHAPPGKTVITNDVGRIPLVDPATDGAPRGFGIPLNKSAVLMLTADGENNARLWHDETRTTWFVWPIRHVVLNPGGVDSFNEAVARHAHMEIYGARREDVEALHAVMAPEPLDEETFEPILIAMNPRARMDTTYARIHRLISIPPSSLAGLTGATDAFPIPNSSERFRRRWLDEHCRGRLWRIPLGGFIGLQPVGVQGVTSYTQGFNAPLRVLPVRHADERTRWDVRLEVERRPFGPDLGPRGP